MSQKSLILGLLVLFAATASAQDKYAVVVGVEIYNQEFDGLDYPNEDAKSLGTALTSLGFTTAVMTSDAKVTEDLPLNPQMIATKIKTIAASCAAGDTLLVSLSGHGVQFSDEPLKPNGTRDTYFCPQSAKLSNKSSMLRISSLMKFMDESKATQKILLVDSCRESVLSPTAKRKSSARRIQVSPVHESRTSVPGGLSVLFSCKSRQFSWEHTDLGHSVFSNFVIAYLNGRADQRFYDNGDIDLDGLVFFVRKRTNEFVFSKNLSPDGQMPILRGSGSNWRFGKLPGNRSLRRPALLKAPFSQAEAESRIDQWVRYKGLSSPSKTGPAKMELQLVPPGEFMMGSRESADEIMKAFSHLKGLKREFFTDAPQHRVQISQPIWFGRYEVTVGQFKQFVDKTGYKTDAERDGEGGWGYNTETKKQEGRKPEYNWKNTGFDQSDRHPVVNVSWNDAIAFCNWLSRESGLTERYKLDSGAIQSGNGFRLPTEAEWEFTCRAGTTTRYHHGDDPEQLVKSGNTWDSSTKEKFPTYINCLNASDRYPFSSAVGQFRSNAFGICDMHGNAWEWCGDWYDKEYYGRSPQRDPSGPSSGSSRVLRGGGWLYDSKVCRSACRGYDEPSGRYSSTGFRVVLSFD